MTRWEDETPAGFAAGRYLSGPEKEAIEGRPFLLESIYHDTANVYEGKPSPRWLVNATVLDTGELVTIALGDNPARNAIMGAGAAALAKGKQLEEVTLEKIIPPTGPEYRIIRSATKEEVDAALVAYDKLPKDEDGNVIAPEPKPVGQERLRKARA